MVLVKDNASISKFPSSFYKANQVYFSCFLLNNNLFFLVILNKAFNMSIDSCLLYNPTGFFCTSVNHKICSFAQIVFCCLKQFIIQDQECRAGFTLHCRFALTCLCSKSMFGVLVDLNRQEVTLGLLVFGLDNFKVPRCFQHEYSEKEREKEILQVAFHFPELGRLRSISIINKHVPCVIFSRTQFL